MSDEKPYESTPIPFATEDSGKWEGFRAMSGKHYGTLDGIRAKTGIPEDQFNSRITPEVIGRLVKIKIVVKGSVGDGYPYEDIVKELGDLLQP